MLNYKQLYGPSAVKIQFLHKSNGPKCPYVQAELNEIFMNEMHIDKTKPNKHILYMPT